MFLSVCEKNANHSMRDCQGKNGFWGRKEEMRMVKAMCKYTLNAS